MIAKALTKFSGREKSASIKPVCANNEIFSFKAECTETNPLPHINARKINYTKLENMQNLLAQNQHRSNKVQ